MYINSHCHVFTYPLIYTGYAAQMIEKRLASQAGIGPILAKAIVNIIKNIVDGNTTSVSG